MVGTFLFPFGKGEEGTQTVLLETSGQTLSRTCVSGSSASLGPTLREPIMGGRDRCTWRGPRLNSSVAGCVDCSRTFRKDLGGH